MEIKIERWEGNEYVLVIGGIGVTGRTLSAVDAKTVKDWLRTSGCVLSEKKQEKLRELEYGE